MVGNKILLISKAKYIFYFSENRLDSDHGSPKSRHIVITDFHREEEVFLNSLGSLTGSENETNKDR